jgi:hypothetical protein
MKFEALTKRLRASSIMPRFILFWGILYATPIGFESMHVDTPIAHSIRECMRAYGELRALTAGVYSQDEAVAYGSRVALMCCSMARYVNALRDEQQSACSCDDLEYVAQLLFAVNKECSAWRPTDARLAYIKGFVLRMISGTNAVLEELRERSEAISKD